MAKDHSKEGIGWITMILCMLGFPALFIVCVYIPMWFGWAARW